MTSSEEHRPEEASADHEGADQEVSKARKITFLVLAILAVVVFGGLFFGIPAIVLGWVSSGDDLIHRTHNIGHGALFGVLISIAVLAQIWKPEQKPAGVQQLGAITIAIIAVLALTFTPEDLGFVGPVVVGLLLLIIAHPRVRDLFKLGELDRMMAGLSVLAAIPLGFYVADQINLQNIGGTDDPHHGHWAGMAVLGVSIVLVGLVGAARTRGWRIPVWTVAVALFMLGLAGVLFPDDASSVGTLWGVIAIVGAGVYVGVAERGARAAA